MAGMDRVQPVGPFDDPRVNEARKRFERCVEWESVARVRFLDDIKFANGDSYNGYQWPNSVRRNRDVDAKPCLTMNVIKPHNRQISNEARKNKSQSKIIPAGGGASVESAQAMQDISQHIELRSDAQTIYTIARDFQVDGGIGWWRIGTEYQSDESMDQEIVLWPVPDPLSIYMDPDIKTPTGADARFAFAFDDIPREEWSNYYPEYGDIVGVSPMGIGSLEDNWDSKDYIRICEYFRRVPTKDTLVSFMYQGQRKNIWQSRLPKQSIGMILNHSLTRTRPVLRYAIEWHLIAGTRVIDSTIWSGKYIPLIRCVGEETIIDGILDRKGHTRAMLDPQRMLNYNASAQIELVAMQGKTPWIAPAKAIEEYEAMWNTANVTNHSVLVWNHIDEDGNNVPPPERVQPPAASQAYQTGMDTAFNHVMMVSGQWQNQMGMMGNERTGAAINARQRQGDTSTFHFQDNYEKAMRFSTVQLIDLIPKIYDTPRVLAIMDDAGGTFEMQIDPKAAQAVQVQLAKDLSVARKVFNPNVGEYQVAPSVGPAYGTRMEETADALTLILTQAPTLVPIIGDLLLGSLSFDKAQEAAQRLRRMVPPAALGTGPSPTEQQLQASVSSLQQALGESLKAQGKAELKLVGKDQMRDIDAYDAETKRLAALSDYLAADPEGVRQTIRALISDVLGTSLTPIIAANADDLDIDTIGAERAEGGEVMPPGARQAGDGNWYVEDAKRPGKFLRVERRGGGR